MILKLNNIVLGVDAYSAEEMCVEPRKREKMAVLRVFRQLTGIELQAFSHYSDGAPYVDGADMTVSVSHCHTHVAVAVGPADCALGVDIERWRDQLERVKQRFLSEASLRAWDNGRESLLRAWTLMEATYKAARINGLDIRNNLQMRPGITVSLDGYDAIAGQCAVTDTDRHLLYDYTSILLEPELIVSLVYPASH